MLIKRALYVVNKVMHIMYLHNITGWNAHIKLFHIQVLYSSMSKDVHLWYYRPGQFLSNLPETFTYSTEKSHAHNNLL